MCAEPTDDRVQAFRERVSAEAIAIVDTKFPEKIDSLGQIVQVIEAELARADTVPADASAADLARKRVPCNPAILRVFTELKRELLDLSDKLDTLRVWIRLHAPRIEEGNNFGVAVQEEILSMLRSGQASAFTLLEVAAKYFMRRARQITKAQREHMVEDRAEVIRDMDEKQLASLRQTLTDLRYTYVILYDKIVKNFDRLQKPKGEGARDRLAMMY